MKKKPVVFTSFIKKNNEIFQIMRISLLMLFCCVFNMIAVNTDAQNATIRLSSKNMKLAQFFDEIEKQTDYLVVYSNSEVNTGQSVTFSSTSGSVSDCMHEALSNSELHYEFENRYIVLTKGAVINASVTQQSGKIIKGKVTDANGEPIIGASVRLKNSTKGSITDIEGEFSLEVTNNSIIQVSYIGYTAVEIKIGSQATINVVLQEDFVGLEEIVIIGYGTTTRQNFTGSVSVLKVEDSPSSLTSTQNVLNLLRGTVPGVTLSRSGEAGANPTMLVRGQRSISNSSQDPLIVVDGVIFNGSINDLDVNSIEDVSVLKDASTLATYGTRAANGVIMITTKKGKRGKPVINFNPALTVSSLNFKPKMRDGAGYIELMNRRSGLDPGAEPAWMGELEKSNYVIGKTTDWLDYITRTGMTQNYSLSFSGATDNLNYYMSGGYWDQKGNYYGDNYQRTTFSAKVNTNINQYVEIGANTNMAFNNSNGVRPFYGGAVSLTPYGESLLKNGNMRKFPDGREQTTTNPLWNTFNGIDDETSGSTIVVGGFLNIKIPKAEGLSYKITGSYTVRSSESYRFTHETNFPDMNLGEDGYTTEVYDTHLRDANGYIIDNSVKSWVLDNILTYNRTVNKNYINATLVYTRDEQEMKQRQVTGSDFRGVGNTILGIYGLPNAEVHKINSFSNTLKSNIGYLGRINYSFDNKYHLNLSLRHDGASVFGKNKKWGTFPSAGVAWSISREDFFKSIKEVDNLKLKLSWGKNGNQSLSPYRTLSPVNMGRGGNQVYYFGGNVAYGQLITALGNPELGWEETSSFNYGFETDLFKQRLHADVNIYSSSTRNQIFSRRIPPMGSGLTSQDATMGQVDNHGVEISLSGWAVKNRKFSYNTGFIFTLNRNKLIDLYGDGQDDIANSLFIGKSLGAIYGYVWDGIVQKGEESYMSNLVATPGDAKYADLNNDGRLTADDRKILGYSKDNFRLSMTNTFTYGKFLLYVLINSTFGGKGYGMASNNSAYLTDDTYYYHNTLDHPYWTPENPSDKYPRWSFMDSRFLALQSYTFIRLQDVNLSYNFNNNLLNKYGVDGIRLYLSCSNLFFYAPEWIGSDPEIRNYNAAQLQRTITFGLNFKF